MFLLEWLANVAMCALVVTAVYYAWQDNASGVSPNIESLTEASTYVARRFQAAIALMLGFYSVQNFARWREVRNVEGDAMGTINDLALQIAWRLRDCSENNGSSKDTNVTFIRMKLIRWLNLSHALVVGEVFEGKRNEFASLDNLVKYGLATAKECTFLKRQDSRYKYAAPFLWFMDLIEDLQRLDAYGVNEGTVNTLSTGAIGIRRKLADLYALKETPIPLSYRQLTNMAVRSYMIMLLLAAALSEKADEYQFGQLSRGSFWIIMVYAWEYFLFVGWLTVADAIGNPYRAWADQLDWDNYVKEINMSSLLIASRFRGEALPEETSDDDSEEDEQELDKLEDTCRIWRESLQANGKMGPKGFKGKRQLLTGW